MVLIEKTGMGKTHTFPGRSVRKQRCKQTGTSTSLEDGGPRFVKKPLRKKKKKGGKVVQNHTD